MLDLPRVVTEEFNERLETFAKKCKNIPHHKLLKWLVRKMLHVLPWKSIIFGLQATKFVKKTTTVYI